MIAARWVRSLQVVVVAMGLVVAWILLTIQQYVWDGGTAGQLRYAPDSWFKTYEAVYQRYGAPRGLSAYYLWGRFAPILYAAVFIGVWALPAGTRRVCRLSRRVLLAAVCAGFVGDVVGYWGGTAELSTLSGIGFGLVEVPALLLMIIAMVVYGVGLAREGREPALVAWSLIAAGVLAIPMSFFVLTYLPHGILVTILLALTVALTSLLLADGPTSSSRSTP